MSVTSPIAGMSPTGRTGITSPIGGMSLIGGTGVTSPIGGMSPTGGPGVLSPYGLSPTVRVSPDSEYTEAEALIITYSLNNFPREDPRYEWVLSWESRFLEVVGDFQRTHGHNLSVAFMAEVRHHWGPRQHPWVPSPPSPTSRPSALAGG